MPGHSGHSHTVTIKKNRWSQRDYTDCVNTLKQTVCHSNSKARGGWVYKKNAVSAAADAITSITLPDGKKLTGNKVLDQCRIWAINSHPKCGTGAKECMPWSTELVVNTKNCPKNK